MVHSTCAQVNMPCSRNQMFASVAVLTFIFLLISCSVTLGGFGADRFYLGQWREGLGKLFSFGGLGIWTLIDVLLIGVGYVGPADGSLYI